jgi:fructosamine-3-kinase
MVFLFLHMPSKVFISGLENLLHEKILNCLSVSGGDISEAFKVSTSKQTYFLKANSSPQALKMFECEKKALDEIRETKTIKTPEVSMVGNVNATSFILMKYIEPKSQSSSVMAKFGKQLAHLHNCTASYFGWGQDNFIGSLPQSNANHESWTDFYIEQRLQTQIKLSLKKGLLSSSEVPSIQTMKTVCSEIFQNVKPSLLHGDLWSGNFLILNNDTPYIIDPATYYGDSLVDIAMSKLFGGFGSHFYESYHEIRCKGDFYLERIELYHLYYLLVHLNLFGRSYYNSVRSILKRYFYL